MKKVSKITMIIISIALILTSAFGLQTFAEEGIISMESNKVKPGETIKVTITLPEDHELVNSDWIGIYDIDADEDNIYDGAGIGIWGYIGSGTKDYGTPESRTVTLEIDETWSVMASDEEFHWPLDYGDYKLLLFYSDSYTVADSFIFRVEREATPTPTEAPITEEPTATPTAEPTEIPATDAPTEAPKDEKKSGCGSVLGISSAFALCTLVGCCYMFRKKK